MFLFLVLSEFSFKWPYFISIYYTVLGIRNMILSIAKIHNTIG